MNLNSDTQKPLSFERLFRASPHPYLILKPDEAFTIAAVNDQYLAATGTRREAIIGHGLFEIFPDNPDDTSGSGVSDLRISLNRVINNRQPDTMGVQKYDIPLRDGSKGFAVKYWSPVNTPVLGPDGSIAFIIHHVEDVTDFILSRERNSEQISKIEARAGRMEAEVLHRAAEVKESNRALKAALEQLELREAELSRLNERLKELDRVKTEFFSNISHEFRTPLTLTLGPLENILAQQDQIPPDMRASLDIARRNALRLLRLVNSLLDISRLEAGRVKPALEATDLASYTADLASHFDSACAAAGIQLSVDCPPLPQTVDIDRAMWEKIVLNLLSNAFKFTFAGSIEVRLRTIDGEAVLSVRDTGTGIPRHELPHLFERFHRVEGARGRSFEGSGIGLALIHELVRLHGGAITVDSEEGSGSTFTVRVPLGAGRPGKAHPNEVEQPDSTHASAIVEEARRWLPESAETENESMTSGGGNVVVADDSQDMRAYVTRLLKAAGFAVEAVNDGEAAFAACLARPPDLVLSDVMMPGLDGYGLLRELRSNAATAILPVILLSARAGEEARVEGLSAGADDYLVKPFGSRELIARVDGAIRLARVRRESQRQLQLADNVFQNITEGVLVTQPDATIISVNPGFCLMTGYRTEELVGRNPRIIKSNRHDTDFYRAMWGHIGRDGSWHGEIWNRRKDGSLFLVSETITAIRDGQGQVQNYVAVLIDITEAKQAEEYIRHQAYHDHLTDLPNRSLFMDRLQHQLAYAHREKFPLAVLYIDLDGFKAVNDELGHRAGDDLLKEAAARLRGCIRESDTIARLGGDEFAVVLANLESAADAAQVTQKMLDRIAQPFQLGSHIRQISASIGIALHPSNGEDAMSLLNAADAAMYVAKRSGKNCCSSAR